VLKILVPVDGSEHALRAVDHAISFEANSKQAVEIHLLNVQPPIISGRAQKVVGRDVVESYYREEGEQALADARARFGKAGVAHVHHIGVGPVAETIAAYVRDQGCAQIIMGTRGLGAVSGLLLGSVATKILQMTSVPVTLVG
jgi:nucleotide-binding universal stress UspA family protein